MRFFLNALLFLSTLLSSCKAYKTPITLISSNGNIFYSGIDTISVRKCVYSIKNSDTTLQITEFSSSFDSLMRIIEKNEKSKNARYLQHLKYNELQNLEFSIIKLCKTNDTTTFKTIYEYDANRNIIKETIYRNENLSEIKNNKYDKFKNPINIESSNPHYNNTIFRTFIEYNYSKKVAVLRESNNVSPSPSSVYWIIMFDNNGYISRVEMLDSMKKDNYITTDNTYDSKFNLIEKRIYDNRKKKTTIEHFDYEFDLNGNITLFQTVVDGILVERKYCNYVYSNTKSSNTFTNYKLQKTKTPSNISCFNEISLDLFNQLMGLSKSFFLDNIY